MTIRALTRTSLPQVERSGLQVGRVAHEGDFVEKGGTRPRSSSLTTLDELDARAAAAAAAVSRNGERRPSAPQGESSQVIISKNDCP